MNRLSIALAASLAAISLASAQSHKDTGTKIINGVAPIYLYISAGVGQLALPIATNTTLTVPGGGGVSLTAAGAGQPGVAGSETVVEYL